MHQEMTKDDNDNVEQDEFCIGNEIDPILDQSLGGEELKELILEAENFF